MDRKKRLSVLLSLMLGLSSIGIQAQTTSITGEETHNVMTQIPGTERTIEAFDKSFFSVTGFASVDGKVNDRTEYIGTEYYREVYNEREFLDALVGAKDGEVKVIELKADLNLGWNELNLDSSERKKYNFVSKYGNPSNGFTNPELEESGVTKMKLGFLNGITIFSEEGNTIKHTEINLTRSSKDVIVRNITFDGMWQWDDTGAHKEVGWSLMKINGAQDIWFDHCTFTHAADGMVDLENGSSGVTLSWCKLGVEADENPSPESQIYKSITYMEERYQKGELGENSRYYKLRSNGATMNQVMAYAAYHSKVNLNGSGDKDYIDYVSSSGNVTPDGNHRLEITVAYSKYDNVGQRVPMIRQGKGHLFNNHIDNAKHMELHNNNAVFNEYGLYSLSRCINPRNGASIAADTCVFDGVEEVIVGVEKQGHDTTYMNPPWDQLFQNAHNNALVVNSRVSNSKGTYTGSSWDNDGENLFTSGFFWNDKATINNWAWSSEIVGRENMHKETPPEDPFEFTYNYDEELPYSYKVISLDQVTDIVENYAGAGVLDFTTYEWLKTEYGVDHKIIVSEMENGTISLSTTLAEAGEKVEVTIAPNEGYALKPGTLKYNGTLIKENNFIMPNEDVVITAEFEKYIPVTNIKLNRDEAMITTGSILKLKASIEPEEAQYKDVEWSSDNEGVAEVDIEGVVTGIEAGIATITATSKDGGFTANCEVKVEEPVIPVKAIKLDTNEIRFTTSGAIQVVASIQPLDATNQLVNWSSSNEEVVTVEDGIVTPLKNGKAIVTATTSEGGFTVSCKVIVDIEAFKPAQYEIVISPMANGQVTASESQATAGETITVVATPNEGYRLKNNTLKYNGNPIINNSFVMPEEDVEITASFERIPSDGSSSSSSSSRPSKPSTIEAAYKALTSKEKADIEKQFKEYAPYTLLNGKLTLEQLRYLTNNKFSDEMLKKLMEHPKMSDAITEFGMAIKLENNKDIKFTDVTSEHWASEAIYTATSLGLIQGMPDGSFNPGTELKVADTFTSLDRYLLMNHFTKSKLSRSTVEKYIMNKEHWAFAHMASIGSKLNEQTLMEIAKLEDKALPRALFAQVIYEVTEGKFECADKKVSFKDIAQSPYEEALVYCVQTGILNGITDELMMPEKSLTRAELMVILMRMNDILQK